MAVKFDLTTLPKNRPLSKATLSLCYKAGSYGTVLRLFTISKDMDYKTATWQNYKSGSAWSNAGGDYDENSKVETKYSKSKDDWDNFDVTALVRNLISSPEKNFGFIIVADKPDDGGMNMARYYYSSNVSDQNKRPQLSVEFNQLPIKSGVFTSTQKLVQCQILNNSLHVKFPQTEFFTLHILDAKGKRVSTLSGEHNSKITMPVSNLSNGIYNVLILTNRNIYNSHFVLMK